MKTADRFCLLSALILLSSRYVYGTKCTLSILSLLSYPDLMNPDLNPDYTDGPDIIPAGYLALELIRNRSNILLDYELELVEGRGGCGDKTLALSEKAIVQHVIQENRRVVGIVGPHCEDSAERVGRIIANSKVALVNIHISNSPFLDAPLVYPYSTSTAPSITRIIDAYVKLIQYYEWEQAKVAFLFEDNELSYIILRHLTKKLRESAVVYTSLVTDSYIVQALAGLQGSQARLVLANVRGKLARNLLCVAARNMTAIHPKYQWAFVFAHSEQDEITDVEYTQMNQFFACSANDISTALNNSITFNFGFKPKNTDLTTKGVSNLTYTEYEKEYKNAVKRYNAGFYGPPAREAKMSPLGNPFHDSIWVLAKALNATDAKLRQTNRTLCEFSYGQPELAQMIQREILDSQFLGAGGHVNYTESSTRSPPGVVDLFFYYNSQLTKFGCLSGTTNVSIKLKNTTFITIIKQSLQLPFYFEILLQLAVLIALILTVPIHVMNVIYRKQDTVKASSHRLNHMAYVGCYLLAATIVILSVTETQTFSLGVKNVLCNALPWTASIGITLIYATLNVKLYRLYNLLIVSIQRFQHPSNSSTILKDKGLLMLIIALTAPDVAVCTLWMILDRIEVSPTSTLDLNSVQPITVPLQSCIVQSVMWPSVWLGLLAGYACALGCVASVNAFRLRSVTMQSYKTDNIVILSALMALMCGIGVPMYIIESKVYANEEERSARHLYLFLTLSLFLVVIVFLSVFLLFLPPVLPQIKKTVLSWTKSLSRVK